MLRPIAALLAVLALAAVVVPAIAGTKADHKAPSAPAGLTATVVSGEVAVRWKASADNVGVKGYAVWRRGNPGSKWSQIGRTGRLRFTDPTVGPRTGYAYAVRAYDAVGNVSASSPIVAAKVPALNGYVLWTADGEKPLSRQWAEYSTATHCAIDSAGIEDPEVRRESSVVAQGNFAYKFTLSQSDRQCYGMRTELGQDLPTRPGFSEPRRFQPGHDYWISFQVMLAGWPLGPNGGGVFAQFKQILGGGNCCPFMTMLVDNHDWNWGNAGARRPNHPLGRVIEGRWVKFSVHFKVSTDPTVGYVEVYGDLNGHGMRRLMPLTHQQTTDSCAISAECRVGTPLPTHSRIGIYRTPATPGTATEYIDGYTVATTRSAAEANAFAPLGHQARAACRASSSRPSCPRAKYA